MKFIGLVLKSARRSKRRTALTMISVALAVFLFAALRAVLDGFDAVVGRELVDAHRDDPLDVDDLHDADVSHAEIDHAARRACRTSPGRTGSAASTRIPKNFFGAVRGRARELPAHVSRDHPDAGGAQGLPRRSHRLHRRRRPGEELRLQGRRQDRRCRSASRSTAAQDFDFTIRGIYQAGSAAVDNQSMMFHWKYADERSTPKGQIGWVVTADRQPRSRDAQVACAIDAEVRELAVRDQDRHRAGVLRRRSRRCSAT